MPGCPGAAASLVGKVPVLAFVEDFVSRGVLCNDRDYGAGKVQCDIPISKVPTTATGNNVVKIGEGEATFMFYDKYTSINQLPIVTSKRVSDTAILRAREKIVKPVYRSMPVGFKSWYDRVRYKV